MLPIFNIKNSIIHSKLISDESPEFSIGYDDEVKYIYSIEEGNTEESIRESIFDFCDKKYNELFPYKKIVVTNVKDINIDLERRFIIWESKEFITILQDELYYINNRVMQFINPNFYTIIKNLKKSKECFQYNKGPNRIDALFMHNHHLLQYEDLIRQFRLVGITEDRLICYLMWYLERYKEVKKLNVYKKALIIEEQLSQCKIWIDLNRLETYPDAFQDTINSIRTKDYIIQEQQGSDKTTGRIFVKNSEASVQTMSKNLLPIVKPKNSDYFLFDVDYKYFEFAIMCYVCDIDFAEDPHLYLANLIFNDPERRQEAKQINYSIIYGGNIDYILKTNNAFDKKEKLEELYLNKIRVLEKQLEEYYSEHGHIVNHFGRRIFPKKETALLNNFISSTATDFLITKLYKLFNMLQDTNSTIVFQKHDSVLFNIAKSETNTKEQIEEILGSEEKGIKARYDSQIYYKNYLID